MSTVTAVPIPPVKRSVKVWLWLAVAAALVAAFGLAWVGTRGLVLQQAPESAANDAAFLAWHKAQPGVRTTASGLQYQMLKSGKGPLVQDNDGVILNILGHFRDGTVFQPKGADQWLVGQRDPASGKSSRIEGYGEAVKLMNKGSVYRFWIPSNLAYGDSPPDPRMRKNAMLIFDIEVQEHLTAAEIDAMRQQQMMQQQMMQQMQQQGQAGKGGQPAPQVQPQPEQ
jgi:FKBP-type peptidyl-prolyl cis-trans isomerase FkpA